MATPPPKKVSGVEYQKLQPKLRTFANGSSTVNAVRAETVGCIKIGAAKGAPALPDQALVQQSLAVGFHELPKSAQKKPKLKQAAADITASVFVQLRDASAAAAALPGIKMQRRDLATLEVPLSKLRELADKEEVVYIEAGQALRPPTPIKNRVDVSSPQGKSLRQIEQAALHKYGAGVLVGIIDVDGFDFSHPDFLDAAGKTRFVSIWDQGGNARPTPQLAGCNYGAEFLKVHLDAALVAAPKLGVFPTDIEPQSQRFPESHGTHVASIAAGNSGVARKAALAGVLIHLEDENIKDRRKSFYDSARVAHAVEYLLDLGERLKMPVSINISLGTNGGSHDGHSPVSRWIDSALSTPGRVACIAAGNAGQERGETADDMGFVMGRIHSSGRLPSAGLSHDLEWSVIGNTRMDVSENELEIWYGAQDRVSLSIRPPGGGWIGPIRPAQFIENHRLANGTVLSVYNELYHPANGCNYLSIYLTPFYSKAGIVGVAAGTWTVRLHAEEIRDGRFHAWIERDDPQPVGQEAGLEYWRFPSFFSETSNVDDSSISSLATGHHVIAVANLDQDRERINISSSQGPTRDGREKPDVAAPGTNITAASGFSDPDRAWINMTGTSMASPYVCGVAALMLAVKQPKNRRLTASQILGIIRRTSRPLPGADYTWRNDMGFGAIDPAACVVEAANIFKRTDLKP